MMQIPARFLTALLLLLTGSVRAKHSEQDPLNDISPGLYAAFLEEVHNVFITVQEGCQSAGSTEQQEAEKARLLNGMRRDNGQWDTNHPRHRLLQALHGFRRYEETHVADVNRWESYFGLVSKRQRPMLDKIIGYSGRFARVKQRLAHNAAVSEDIVQAGLRYYEMEATELEDYIRDTEKGGSAGRGADKVSVSQTLKHFVRDWASEGGVERGPGFSCVFDILRGLNLPAHPSDGQRHQVLIPGAGLGRLGHAVAQLGYQVTINEWSMYMNVAYRYLEQQHCVSESQILYPFVDNWSHHATDEDMQRPVSFPDVVVNSTSVVLVEGDFTTAFHGHAGEFDAVITYFFIDTARNLMTYLETIHRLLRPGGYWINFGPLLYGSAPFVQLSLEEILLVSQSLGFSFVAIPSSCGEHTLSEWPVRWIESIYGFNERALVKHAYKAQAWAAQKR